MAKRSRRRTTLRPLGYLTPKEAAGYFGCTDLCVKLWLQTGKLKGIKTQNGYWYIKESDLAKELEARGLAVPNLPKKRKREYSSKPIEINLKAAMEFGFSIEKAMPMRKL